MGLGELFVVRVCFCFFGPSLWRFGFGGPDYVISLVCCPNKTPMS